MCLHNRPFSVAIFRVLVIGKSQIAYTLHLDLVIELHCTDSVCTQYFPSRRVLGQLIEVYEQWNRANGCFLEKHFVYMLSRHDS